MTDTEYALATLGLALTYAGLAASIEAGDMTEDVAIDLVLVTWADNRATAQLKARNLVRGIRRGLMGGATGTRCAKSDAFTSYIATGR